MKLDTGRTDRANRPLEEMIWRSVVSGELYAAPGRWTRLWRGRPRRSTRTRDRDRAPTVSIFTDTGFDINGVSIGLRRLVRAMRENGSDARLVVCGEQARYRAAALGYREPELKVLDDLKEFTIPFYDEMAMGIPSLVDVADYLIEEEIDVVQVSTPGPLGLVTLAAAKVLGLPVIANYHTELAQYARRITGDASFAAIVKVAVSAFYRSVDQVIVPSAAVVGRLEEYGVERGRIRRIRRGVDTVLYNPDRRERGIWREMGLDDSPKALYVGRVSREKGLDVLLEAFSTIRRAGTPGDLVVVGDGPYLEELERHKQPGVAFLGYRTGEDLAALYASADVFAFPSATDTFGNVVLEAQASGIPSVVVDRGGPPTQITSGEHGLVVPAEDPGAFAAALGGLLLDPLARTRMGELAHLRAASLSLSSSAAAHWSFYASLLDPPAAAYDSPPSGFDGDGLLGSRPDPIELRPRRSVPLDTCSRQAASL